MMNKAPTLLIGVLLAGCSVVEKAPVAPAQPPVSAEDWHIIKGEFKGETIDIACNRFLDDYFKDTKPGAKRPHHGLTLIYQKENEARVKFYMYTVHWGFEEELLLEKRLDQWVVTRRETYQTYDF